jgi:hypothetical protein
MGDPLNRLFKEKLGDHQVPTDDAVWSKVEASLDNRKPRAIIWFRAAAAVVLLSLLTATMIWVRSREEAVVAKIDSTRIAPEQKTTRTSEQVQHNSEVKTLPVAKKKPHNVNVFIAEENDKKEDVAPAPEQPVQQEETVLLMEETPLAPIDPVQPEMKKTRPAITLTYTLAPVPSRKSNQPVDEEKNGLQKVVDVAMEAKYSDGALTEIRTMKDDLFALNFRKNNKK